MDMIGDGPGTPFFIKPITRAIVGKVYTLFLADNLKTHFTFLEQQLATSPDEGKFLCGKDLTAADILMGATLIAAKSRKKFERTQYPKLVAYTEMMENHEGYTASIKKVEEVSGEPFKAM
ncbi:bifunctional glutathione transferase/peroxidase [Teratosphaeriaceae sp. CCFEE 6253]|nr:bifunctional glutathione transferase/peroxidase [Teratosphaeriaceae sp. CCFEE 6253]